MATKRKFQEGQVARYIGDAEGFIEGEKVTIYEIDDDGMHWIKNSEDYKCGVDEKTLEPYHKTLDDLTVGETIVDPEGTEREVYAICGVLIACSPADPMNYLVQWKKLSVLKDENWKLKDQPEEEKKTILTDNKTGKRYELQGETFRDPKAFLVKEVEDSND